MARKYEEHKVKTPLSQSELKDLLCCGWKPIETAPNNGKVVLVVWNKHDYTTGPAFYRDGKWVAAAIFYRHSAGDPPYEFRETVVDPVAWTEQPDLPTT